MKNYREKSITKTRKFILRVRNRAFEIDLQNGFFHFSGSFGGEISHHQNDISQFNDAKKEE